MLNFLNEKGVLNGKNMLVLIRYGTRLMTGLTLSFCFHEDWMDMDLIRVGFHGYHGCAQIDASPGFST